VYRGVRHDRAELIFVQKDSVIHCRRNIVIIMIKTASEQPAHSCLDSQMTPIKAHCNRRTATASIAAEAGQFLAGCLHRDELFRFRPLSSCYARHKQASSGPSVMASMINGAEISQLVWGLRHTMQPERDRTGCQTIAVAL